MRVAVWCLGAPLEAIGSELQAEKNRSGPS